VLDAPTYLAVNGLAVEAVVAGAAVPGYARRGEALIHADARIAADALLAGPVLIGQGAEIHAGAVVIGPTSIGCDVVIHAGALVSRSAVWRRSAIEAGASVDRCIVGDGTVIQTMAPGRGPAVGRPRRPERPSGVERGPGAGPWPRVWPPPARLPGRSPDHTETA
jgi:NDP-sugar pyrophosphorylase family protein